MPMAGLADDTVPPPPLWDTVAGETGQDAGGYVGVITLPGANVGTDLEPRYNPGCQVTAEAPVYDHANRSIVGVVTGSCDAEIPLVWTRGFLDRQVEDAWDCQGERCAVEEKAAHSRMGTRTATVTPRFGCDDTDPPDPERCYGLWRTRGFVEFRFEHPVSDSQIPAPKWYYSCFRDPGSPYILKCHFKTPKTAPAEPSYIGNCSGPGCVAITEEPIDVQWVR